MARVGLIAVIAGVYLLHQDTWLWGQPRPLAFGFLPPGLTYHAAYCLAVAGLMWLLTRLAWPGGLDDDRARPAREAPPPGAPPSLEQGPRR
jgi:hypothetical protein